MFNNTNIDNTSDTTEKGNRKRGARKRLPAKVA